MGRSRSAEQTARLLLSRAFRHDTFECATSSHAFTAAAKATRAISKDEKDDPSKPRSTEAAADRAVDDLSLNAVQVDYAVQLQFRDVGPEETLLAEAGGIQVMLFDVVRKTFVGATYRLHPPHLRDSPLWFHSVLEDTLLVVEVLERGAGGRGRGPSSLPSSPVSQDTPGGRSGDRPRVLCWGFLPLAELSGRRTIDVRQGTAHLLYLDETQWPREPVAPAATGKHGKKAAAATSSTAAHRRQLGYDCQLVSGTALSQLLVRLIPRGICVSDSFVNMGADVVVQPFRCVIRGIVVSASEPLATAGLQGDAFTWSIAAVAHNGYQQLGNGAEVPLKVGTATQPRGEPALLSVGAMEIDDLPLHATTSVVLAIRRCRRSRTTAPPSVAPEDAPPSPSFEVVGFCVFPLCVMPMKDRDIHIADLPALSGPFSCRDPRLRMFEAEEPYARVPLTLTMTVEYHDTPVPAARRRVSTGGSRTTDVGLVCSSSDSVPVPDGEVTSDGTQTPPTVSEERRRPVESAAAATAEPPAIPSPAVAEAPWKAEVSRSASGSRPHEDAAPPTVPQLTAPPTTTRATVPDLNIYSLLCSIMEELRKVTDTQDRLLRHTAGLVGDPRYAAAGREAPLPSRSPQRMEATAQELADASSGTPELVDLVPPQQVGITWELRSRMQEGLQPILHPMTGTRLESDVAVSSSLTGSLLGMRFDGVTADEAVPIPDHLLLRFSFGPLPAQEAGPVQCVLVGKSATCATFQLRGPGGAHGAPPAATVGGFVWCEPLESVQSAAMRRFKADGTLHVHLYDATTLFYVATCPVALSHFRRPFRVESAQIPLDLPLHKDYTYTERVVPETVLPLLAGVGQLHLTLFAVAVEGGEPHLPRDTAVDGAGAMGGGRGGPSPSPLHGGGGRIVTAQRLPNLESVIGARRTSSTTDREVDRVAAAAAAAAAALAASVTKTEAGRSSSGGTPSQLHWQRAAYVKRLLAQPEFHVSRNLPGVPSSHIQQLHDQQDAEMEFTLRYAEKQREERKAQKIAEALLARLTVHHRLSLAAGHPEVVKSAFQNPFPVLATFHVEVAAASEGVLEVLGGRSTFTLGPKESHDIPFVVRYFDGGPGVGDAKARVAPTCLLSATVLNERGEPVQFVKVEATIGPMFVDRRYDLFGSPGAEVTKSLFSRQFTAASLPVAVNEAVLVARMRGLCAYCTTSEAATVASTRAVVDPITQTHLSAWEEVEVTTRMPEEGTQRMVYLTLYHDEAMTRVYETWELRLLPAQETTAHDLLLGQTSTVTVTAPAERLYCSDPTIRIARHSAVTTATTPTYLLHMRPQAVGSQVLLLHAVTAAGHVNRIRLTVPCVLPTPTFTQVLELSARDVAAEPVFRRLRFANQGGSDQIFRVHHNYKYNLFVTPLTFALGPDDVQYLSLRFDLLVLPPGQLEGRWAMWIFINDSGDRTVESHLIHVVVRAHGLGPTATPATGTPVVA